MATHDSLIKQHIIHLKLRDLVCFLLQYHAKAIILRKWPYDRLLIVYLNVFQHWCSTYPWNSHLMSIPHTHSLSPHLIHYQCSMYHVSCIYHLMFVCIVYIRVYVTGVLSLSDVFWVTDAEITINKYWIQRKENSGRERARCIQLLWQWTVAKQAEVGVMPKVKGFQLREQLTPQPLLYPRGVGK